MNCTEAIKTIMACLKEDDICIFTTGYISRRAFAANDRKANLYVLGSMGLVSSVGLGLALNTPKRVFIFDGDGSVLMDMGTMSMIANHRSENLFHIVLDNNAYESTGCQSTISKKVDLSKVAEAAGYSKVFSFDEIRKLKDGIGSILLQKGPIFMLLKIDMGDRTIPPRVSIRPEEITRRIMEKL